MCCLTPSTIRRWRLPLARIGIHVLERENGTGQDFCGNFEQDSHHYSTKWWVCRLPARIVDASIQFIVRCASGILATIQKQRLYCTSVLVVQYWCRRIHHFCYCLESTSATMVGSFSIISAIQTLKVVYCSSPMQKRVWPIIAWIVVHIMSIIDDCKNRSCSRTNR